MLFTPDWSVVTTKLLEVYRAQNGGLEPTSSRYCIIFIIHQNFILISSTAYFQNLSIKFLHKSSRHCYFFFFFSALPFFFMSPAMKTQRSKHHQPEVIN